MSVRALGSFLTRRLSPRGIPRAQAQAESSPGIVFQEGLGSATGRERAARSLHTLVGDGALGVLFMGALAGLVGYLCVQKDTDESAGEEAKKRMPDNKPISEVIVREAIKQGDMKQVAIEDDGGFSSLEDCLAEMTELAAEQKRARYNRDVSRKKAINEVTGRQAVKQEDMEDEAAMKARFEEWMKEYSRTYKNDKEKARRYEIFKSFAKTVDKATARGGAVFITNHTADWTEEEFIDAYCCEVDWDEYLDDIKFLIAKAKKEASDKKVIRDLSDSEAIKLINKEGDSSDSEVSLQADNR